MKLYHGTNSDFEKIDIGKSKRHKDFGCGFYLTDIHDQALAWAQKRAMLFGGTPIVQEYEFDESFLDSPSIKSLIFHAPNVEWARFVYNNRSKNTPDFKHGYDIVVGPIADDGVAYLLGRYEEGTYSIEELAKELEFKKLNRQYFFGSEKAIKLLKRKQP